jgi:HSP20 family protein
LSAHLEIGGQALRCGMTCPVSHLITGVQHVPRSDKAYTVKLEMPGVGKEDVHVSVDGRRVTVQAETKKEEEKKEGDRVVYRERSVSSYSRSFSLPSEVDEGASAAKLENVVLTLTLNKRAAPAAKKLTVG